MAIRSKDVLKSYFEIGDVPREDEFADLIDSFLQVPQLIDCSTNPLYPASNAGDTYKVTLGGKIGGINGLDVVKDAVLIALENSVEGEHSSVSEKWVVLNNYGQSVNINTNNISEFKTLANDGLLETGKKYIISNPSDGGQIVVEASSSATINSHCSWITSQNWKAFGWFRLSNGNSGSITAVNINNVNILSASIAYNTSLKQTVIDIATNINSGNSGYKAYPINDLCVIEYQTVTTTVNNHTVAAVVSGSLQTSNLQNMTRGGDPTIIYSLPIKYDLENDCIIECSDKNQNVMTYNFTAGSNPRPITIFRWNDVSYRRNKFNLCDFKQNFIATVTSHVFSNNLFEPWSRCQFNVLSGDGAYIAGNVFGIASLFSNNYFINGRIYYNILNSMSSLSNTQLLLGNINNNTIGSSASIDNNILGGGYITINDLAGSSQINDNILTYPFNRIQNNSLSIFSKISSNNLAANAVRIINNILNGTSSQISFNILNGDSVQIQKNVLTGTNAQIISKVISNLSENIEDLTYINGKIILTNVNEQTTSANSKMLIINEQTKEISYSTFSEGQSVILTGDVTSSGTNPLSTTISNQAVTFEKLQNIGSLKVLGRSTVNAGSVEEISLSTELSLSGGVLSLSDGSITYNKIQNVSSNKLLGRSSAGSGIAEELTIGTGLALSGGVITSNGYVDNAFKYLSHKAVCRVASVSDLWSNYNNGNSGINATLTNASTNTALVIDGVALAINDRVLIRLQNPASRNGIYVVTNAGSASSAWVLRRADDNDTPSKIYQTTVVIKEGQTYASIGFVNSNTSISITIGTTDVNFKIASGVTFGGGLTFAGSSVYLSTNGVSRSNLSTGIANSVIGRSANSVGNVADIQATVDGHILRRTGGVLGFGFAGLTKIASKTNVNANVAGTTELNWASGIFASSTVPMLVVFRYLGGSFSPHNLVANLTLNGSIIKQISLPSLVSGMIKTSWFNDQMFNNAGNWNVVVSTPIGQSAAFDIEVWGTV